MQDVALAPALLLGVPRVRWILTLLAWLVSVALLAPLCFFAVIGLAGPHGGVLPSHLQPLVLIVGWALILIVPGLIARAVWRRGGAQRPERAD